MHYGSPSSLPSDYALLSNYANARGITADVQDDSRVITPRPLQPKPKLPEPLPSNVLVADEYTPLLVPRIEEEVDTHSPSTATVYGDELRILVKYTLPVLW